MNEQGSISSKSGETRISYSFNKRTRAKTMKRKKRVFTSGSSENVISKEFIKIKEIGEKVGLNWPCNSKSKCGTSGVADGGGGNQ